MGPSEAADANGDMDAMGLFRSAIKTDATLKAYEPALLKFLAAAGLGPDAFAAKAKAEPKWAEGRLLSFIAGLRSKGYAPQSIRAYLAPVTLFLDMNDVTGMNLKRVKRTIPAQKKANADRAYTPREVAALAGDSDYRVRCGVLLMFSAGLRIGGLAGLCFRDVEPVKRGGDVEAAWVTVYRGTPEQYRALATPEAWKAVEDYRAHRKENGEEVGPSSPLLRDLFSPGRAATVRPMNPRTLQNLLLFRLLKLRLRPPKNGGKRYEVALAHGFRKGFKSQAEASGMKSIAVELLMGHEIGVSGAYYKPTDAELLKEYLKAVPRLTVLSPHVPQETAEEMDALKARIAALESDRPAQAQATATLEAVAAFFKRNPDMLNAIQAATAKGAKKA